MGGPGNALALLAIAVGATAQLTVSEGPFSLWSSTVGLLLLVSIAAYRKEIGYTPLATLAFSLITGYVLLFTLGIGIDYATAENAAVLGPAARLFCPSDASKVTVEGVTKCLVEPRDVIMFCSWLAFSFLAFVADKVLRPSLSGTSGALPQPTPQTGIAP